MTKSGNLNSFEGIHLWGLPKLTDVSKGEWVVEKLNHVSRLVIFCSAEKEDWKHFLIFFGATDAIPAYDPFFEDLRQSMAFAEPYLSDEFNRFNADYYINPLVHGFRNFIVFDEVNQKCIFYFSR